MKSADFEQKRQAMVVSQLRTSGVSEGWVVAAMGALPRETFVPADRSAAAYMDRSVPLGGGRALNPPLATGLMLINAEVRADDHVLLIGAGTGYLASLLAGRAASVVAVEEDVSLLATAKTNLKGISNVKLVEGPLNEGASGSAPYSLVIIDGAIAVLPEAITAQLADGGRVVAGLVDGAVTRLALGYCHNGHVSLRPFADGEIALLPGFAQRAEFVF